VPPLNLLRIKNIWHSVCSVDASRFYSVAEDKFRKKNWAHPSIYKLKCSCGTGSTYIEKTIRKLTLRPEHHPGNKTGTQLTCLLNQNKSGFFEGQAFFQPIIRGFLKTFRLL